MSYNMQYSSYKSCKDIRDSKINKILTNLSSQSLIVKSLWNESFNENIEHWYTSFQNLPKNIYNFSTRYIQLPTLKNMTMWKKTSTGLCKFCLNSQTLQHVVSGCKVYLHEGRYNWRHDSILKNLVTYFKSIRGNLKYYVDIPGSELPSVITGVERRPDIVIRDKNKLYMIEITVGFETRISINAERKLKHYENLCKELSQGFESVIYVNLSMGALGLIGKDSKKFYDLLKMTLKLEKDQTNYLI